MNWTFCFSSEVIQARRQISEGESADNQPIIFFQKVCFISHLYLNLFSLHCEKKKENLWHWFNPLPISFSNGLLFFLISFFFSCRLWHLISFVRRLPWAIPISQSLCGHVIYLTISEIHVGVSIAIRIEIKASHAALPPRRQPKKRIYFSLMGPPESDPFSQDYEQSCLTSLHTHSSHLTRLLHADKQI